MRASNQAKGMAVVLGSAVLFGLNPLFARLAFAAGLDSVTALIYRFLVPAIIITLFIFRRPVELAASLRALAIGLGMGLGMIGYFTALETLPVSTVALIYFTYPVFTLLIGLVFFGIAISRKGLMASVLILLACFLILDPADLPPGSYTAVLASFAAPIGFSFLIHGIAHWLLTLPVISRTGLLMWGQVLALIPFILSGAEGEFLPLSLNGWFGVAGLATVSSLIPQVLVVVGAPLAGAQRTAVAGTFELITALAIGWAVLKEPVTIGGFVGGLLVLSALYIYRPKTSDLKPAEDGV